MHLLEGGLCSAQLDLGGSEIPDRLSKLHATGGKGPMNGLKPVKCRIFPVFRMKILAHGRVDYGWGLSPEIGEIQWNFPHARNDRSDPRIVSWP